MKETQTSSMPNDREIWIEKRELWSSISLFTQFQTHKLNYYSPISYSNKNRIGKKKITFISAVSEEGRNLKLDSGRHAELSNPKVDRGKSETAFTDKVIHDEIS
jgi:hypothetical protein